MNTATRLAPAARFHPLVRKALIALAGSLLLWLSAKAQAPFWPAPMTMQTLAVLGLAAALGRNMGLAAVGLYLLEGALGLPVFAGGGGAAYMAGLTGGYLAGFALAALIVGEMADRGWTRRLLPALGVMLAGAAAIHVPGVMWLAGFIGPEKALLAGSAPYILGDLLKAAIVALAVSTIRRAPRG